MPSGVIRNGATVALATLIGVGATACADEATPRPVSAPAPTPVRPGADAGEPGPSWTYAGAAGPAAWSTLAAEFRTCGTGARQSPIDLAAPDRKSGETAGQALVVDYRPVRVQLVNIGHTVQANVSGGSRILLGGHAFALRQFHFHRPSEHTVRGAHAAMELHLVHADADGAPAVLAVLLTQRPDRSALSAVLSAVPDRIGTTRDVPTPLDPGSFLPAGRDHFLYDGSLTTPPCTEGVRWAVLTDRSPVAVNEVAAYRALFPKSIRPIQPRRGRPLTLVTSRQARS